MDEPGTVWIDDDAGPVVRPYAVTAGRTRTAGRAFDLIALIVARRPAIPADAGLGSEYAHILHLCQQPLSVAEIATALNLPTGTVRVLLADLVDRELVSTGTPAMTTHVPTDDIFRAVIDGIRAL